MATINRLDNANVLNLGAAWSGGVAPGVADVATWNGITVNISTNLGGSVSWDGVALTSAQTANITIGGGVAGTLTLGASGVDLSAAGANLTSAAGVTIGLGATQTWTVGAGRTYTVSGLITSSSGTLNIAGSGTVSLASATRSGWAGNAVVVQSGVRLSAIVSNGDTLGATSNTFTVQSGGALSITGTNTANFLNLTVSGEGNALQYGAFYLSNGGAGVGWQNRTVTVAASDTVISFANGPIRVAGTVAGDVIYNVSASTSVGASTVTAGGYIRVRSWNITTRAHSGQYLILVSNDSGAFGAATNNVFVENSAGFTPSIGGIAFTRNYTFEGETTNTAPAAGKAYTADGGALSSVDFNFNGGSITAASDRYLKFRAASVTSNRGLNFTGTKLIGGFGIRTFSAMNVLFGTASDISEWTGSIQATNINYQKAPVGAAIWDANAVINNTLGSALTLQHSGYTVSSFTFTGSSSMSLGSGSVTSATSPTITVSANTLTIPGNVSVLANLVKAGGGTLVLSGNNTIPTGVTLSAGTLVLNSAGSAGPSAATFVFETNAILDSTVGATLNQNGAINTGALAGTWTWVGTSDLTFGTGNITLGGDRVIAFGAGGGLGTLKFRGNITTTTATLSWNFGGSTAGAKQRVTLGGSNASLAAGTAADQPSVTAGYFRIENNNGLGAAGTTTTWWVGATNLGVQTTKSALELAGVTTPDTKSVNLYNIGPNDDGALIGVSGTSEFRGGISIPNVAGTRFGAKSGATLTISSGFYTVINAANPNTPLSFVAETGGQINVDRVLGGPTVGGSNIGTVTVANGSGTVVLSRANLHTGGTVCSAGTTKVTNVNATAAGNVTVSAGATLESTVQSQFQSTLSLGTTSSLSRAILKFAA